MKTDGEANNPWPAELRPVRHSRPTAASGKSPSRPSPAKQPAKSAPETPASAKPAKKKKAKKKSTDAFDPGSAWGCVLKSVLATLVLLLVYIVVGWLLNYV